MALQIHIAITLIKIIGKLEILLLIAYFFRKEWGEEKNIKIPELRSKIPHKFFKLPIIGKKLGNINGLLYIAKEQIKAFKPEILYCQDLSFFSRRNSS